MGHEISGKLKIAGEVIDFGRQRIYRKRLGAIISQRLRLDADKPLQPYGRFPCKASVAKIPWFGVPLLVSLLDYGSIIDCTVLPPTIKRNSRKCAVSKDEAHIVLENKEHLLGNYAHRDHATVLASPILGLMEGRIEESMTSEIELKLTEKKSGNTIFNDSGRNTGLEVAGSIEEIIT
jgi:tocopherol cyclase